MRDKNNITNNITNINTDINTDNSTTSNTNNRTERNVDCVKDLCDVLEKLKDGLCDECEEKEDLSQEESRSQVNELNKGESHEEESKEGESHGEESKEGESNEKKQKENSQDDITKTTNSNKKSGCKIKQCLERIRLCLKHEKNDPNNKISVSNANDNMGFVASEIDTVRPVKTQNEDNHNCVIGVLVLCLVLPFVLLFVKSLCPNKDAVILNKVTVSSTTSNESNLNESESNDDTLKNESVVVFGTAVLEGSKSNVKQKQNGKTNLEVEGTQKESCCREILFGISAIVLMGSILCVILIYVKYLRERQKREYDIDDSILEFNKRAYFELLKLRTSELAIQRQVMEQDLELAKQAELLRFEEEQKCFEHKRRHDMRCFDLREKYLEKATEVINKYYETQKVDRKEREVRVEAPNRANVNVGYNEGEMNHCNNTEDKSK